MTELDLKHLYRSWRRQAPGGQAEGNPEVLLGDAASLSESDRDSALLAAAQSREFELAQRVARELAPNTEALVRALHPGQAQRRFSLVSTERASPLHGLAMAAGFMAFALVGVIALRGSPPPAPAPQAAAQPAPAAGDDIILDGSFESSGALAQLHLPGDTVFNGDFDG